METESCICTAAIIHKACASVQRSERIGGIVEACFDITSDWQKSQIFISAKKVDMRVAKYDNGIILVVV